VLRHWLAGDDYDHKASGFMGKGWDSFVPGPAVWREVFRVLKPGGHVFAFSGTRTYDMAVLAMRLAGFEIRDQFAWVYGSGMPKSLDIGKAIDKAAGAEREVVGQRDRYLDGRERQNLGDKNQVYGKGLTANGVADVTAPATAEAATWDGWGTAVKPAWEPIVLARKPFPGTVAANVLKHGTGGLNIDACRIPVDPIADAAQLRTMNRSARDGSDGWGMNSTGADAPQVVRAEGRWPANLLHDGSDGVLAHFPTEAGAVTPVRGTEPSAASVGLITGEYARVPGAFHADAGSAARFFYCAKASTAEREAGLDGLSVQLVGRGCAAAAAAAAAGKTDSHGKGGFNRVQQRRNIHPTVKPIAVGRWLQRMITPPGGTTLDIYVGSGSFGASAILEGFNFIGIDIDDDGEGNPLGYLDIARARCEWAEGEVIRERQRREQELREAAARAAQAGLFEEAV